tara:strand:+ start:333 stop:815 length:483 start_codon:yes stop_codon:yes gene_type:complete
MFFIIKTILSFFTIIIAGCTSSNFTQINYNNQKTISIETPKDRYNIILKEHLKRNFNNEDKDRPDYILKANVSFNSNETLSISGLSVLNSTKAVVKYSLTDFKSNLLVKSGLIQTFPALSSSSNSIYSNERSLEHIKERLTQSSANKLHMITEMNLRKLN